MVVLLMTEGGLLFLLSAQGLAVGAVGRGSAVLHGISTLTTLQTAALRTIWSGLAAVWNAVWTLIP